MSILYTQDCPSMDEFKELSDFVDSNYKELEQLNETVSSHEEILADLIAALVDDEGLSQSTREYIQKLYNKIYGKQ